MLLLLRVRLKFVVVVFLFITTSASITGETKALPFHPLLILLHGADERTALPDLTTVQVKHKRDRDDEHLDEAEQRAGPIRAERVVHVRPRQRQRAARDRP